MPVKIGFIGAGGMGMRHAELISQMEEAHLVAFCDVEKNRALQAAHRFSHFEARFYTDYKKLLEAENLDALYICLPPYVHKDMGILAAQKGCALFIEKPIGLQLKNVERVAAAIEEANITTAVGYHFRYHHATQQARELLMTHPQNVPALVYGRWLGGFPNSSWWRKMNQSGGQIHEQATHILDLARYFVGEIEKVYCCAARREMHRSFRDSNVPDVTALTAEFANGAIGHFASTCMVNGVTEAGLSLVAKDVIYDLHGNALNIRRDGETHSFLHRNNPLWDENRAFLEAVQTGVRGAIKSNYADAMKTLRVTLAANQSAKTGKPVKIKI